MPAVLTDASAAATLRRRLGPLAWCALEVLVARGRPVAGGLVTDASVRVVAAELAVGTNTAQRALRTLRTADLVEPAQRRDAAGRFATASCQLALPPGLLMPTTATPQPKQPSTRRPTAQRSIATFEQLVLVPSE